MRDLLAQRYYWPGLGADCAAHVQQCHECTLAKGWPHKTRTTPVRSDLGQYPFDEIVADIEVLPASEDGFTHLVVFVDTLTRWVEAVPFKGDPSSEQVLDAFLREVVCRHGVPRVVRGYNGKNLVSRLCRTIYGNTRTKPAPLCHFGHSRW